MAKFLIPLNNTPWGVITNSIAPDTYEHVLSFNNEEIKKQFIGKELFNDVSFDYMLNIELYETSFILTNDGLDGIITIDLDYVNSKNENLQYSLTDLMNIDSIFIKEDGKINLYAVNSSTRTNTQNNVSVEYSISLDVMFNSIDELELSGQVEIQRAHTDRHNGSNYLIKNNTVYEDQFETLEPVVLENNHEIFAKALDNPSPASTVSGIKWAIIYSKLNEGEEGVISESFIDENGDEQFTRLPYKIFLTPLKYEFDVDDEATSFYYVDPDPNEDDKILSINTYEHFRDASTTISIQYTNDVPIPLENIDYIGDGYYITISDARVTYYDTGTCLELKDLRISYDGLQFYDIQLTSPQLTSYNEEKNINNEAKLQFSQFTKLKFNSRDKDGDLIIRERLEDSEDENIVSNIIELGYVFGFQSELIASLIYADNEKLDNNLINKKGLLKVINNEIPTNTDAYNEYLALHRLQSKTGYLGGIFTKTITGAVAGIAGGKPGLGALAGFTSGIMDSIKFGVQMNDIKNTPDTPKEVSNQYGLDYKIDGNNYIYEYKLPYDYLITIFDFLYSMGYKINKIGDVKEFMNSRYYFNYIQTDNIFSLIKNRYSPARKQIINDTFKKGFTIWHVRDLNTFKGISNYKYENQEINLIGLKKKDLKTKNYKIIDIDLIKNKKNKKDGEKN